MIIFLVTIQEAFDAIILAEDCIAGKPDPAPYQAALDKFQIKAENAIALEDSPSGIRAAVAAGIPTIGIASTHNPDILQAIGAFMAISDFTDLQLWTFVNYSDLPTAKVDRSQFIGNSLKNSVVFLV